MRRVLHLLARPFWVLLAVLFLIEAWFWGRLSPIFARLLSRVPWHDIRAAFARGAAKLPAWAAVPIFLVPFLGVEPLKAVALFMVAEGRIVRGALLFGAAQIVALGLSAFVFDLFRPQLLSYRWFAWCYERCVRAHHWALQQVEPLRRRMMLTLKRFEDRESPLRQRIASLRRWAKRPFRTA